MEVRKPIRDYCAIMHAEIGAAVLIDKYNHIVFVYDNDPRDPTKAEHGIYYVFEKDVGEVVDRTIDVNTYDQHIGTDLQLPDKDGIKWMKIFC